jgi:hypothetical protein
MPGSITQLGLLRLLATSAVMGKDVRTIGQASTVYDRWLEESRVSLRHEVFEFDAAFRAAARSVSRLSSPKALGDCYLRAVSQVTDATLVPVPATDGLKAPKQHSKSTRAASAANDGGSLETLSKLTRRSTMRSVSQAHCTASLPIEF